MFAAFRRYGDPRVPLSQARCSAAKSWERRVVGRGQGLLRGCPGDAGRRNLGVDEEKRREEEGALIRWSLTHLRAFTDLCFLFEFAQTRDSCKV